MAALTSISIFIKIKFGSDSKFLNHNHIIIIIIIIGLRCQKVLSWVTPETVNSGCGVTVPEFQCLVKAICVTETLFITCDISMSLIISIYRTTDGHTKKNAARILPRQFLAKRFDHGWRKCSMVNYLESLSELAGCPQRLVIYHMLQ